MTAQGNETEIKITDMSHGEAIELRAIEGGIEVSAWWREPGTYKIPFERMEKFRAIKHVNNPVTPLPTNVEIVLNGTS